MIMAIQTRNKFRKLKLIRNNKFKRRSFKIEGPLNY